MKKAKSTLRRQLRYEPLEQRQLLTTFYVDDVATNGAGTFASPFNTIQAGANAAHAGDAVLIRGGTYRETVSVPSSGTSAAPITFRVYNDEEVVISGGDSIGGWTLAPTVGPDVWVANAPWNTNGNTDANTFFVDGDMKYEARLFAENDFLDRHDWGQHSRSDFASDFSSITLSHLAGYGDDYWNGATLNFVQQSVEIVDYQSATGKFTFANSLNPSAKNDWYFHYINDTLKVLDKPGEWHKQGSSLYYKAAPGENPNNLETELKSRPFAFQLGGRSHITLEGLVLRGASIDTNSGTNFLSLKDNVLYAYDRANFGRMFFEGDNYDVRGNEFYETWNQTFSTTGDNHVIVNNYFHDIGLTPLNRVLGTTGASDTAEDLLFSRNTVRKFSRSVFDGYPNNADISYNLFEQAGTLTLDTGVFDSDGGNGNSSQAQIHHNVFRDTDTHDIYMAFYGRNDNAVIHHNIIYDFQSAALEEFRAFGTNFRQVYHNTIISNTPPNGRIGSTLPDAVVQTRYNNNLQISLINTEALGVDTRGNHNFKPGDFVNFAGGDLRLQASSVAVDTGIVLPGINDGTHGSMVFGGEAPDAGALELGQAMWDVGHDSANPPNPNYSWTPLPGTNLASNSLLRDGMDDWTILAGTTDAQDRNSWNLQQSGAALTGSFRTKSIEFLPGAAISKTYTGLKPNTTYTFGAVARLANRLNNADDYDSSSGSITTGTHRGEDYITDMTAGEWVRYSDVDFGEPGQYDRLDFLQIRPPGKFETSIDNVGIQVRLGSPTGPLLTEIERVRTGTPGDRWRADRGEFSGVSGLQDLYVSVSGANSSNLGIGSFRLLKSGVPAEDRLTARISSPGSLTQVSRLGSEDWIGGYEEITFTTGPTATEATVEFSNDGRLNAYLDRVLLVESYSTRGDQPRDISSGAVGFRSIDATTAAVDGNLTDGLAATETVGGDHVGSWVQVDLGQQQAIYDISLAAPQTAPGRLSNFRVSVWSSDPQRGGTELWGQDFLTDSHSLDAGEVLKIQADSIGRDGQTRLNSAQGRFIRVQLLGPNSAGGNQIALGEIQINGYDLSNLTTTDSIASQSSTAGNNTADLAGDTAAGTYSETLASATNSWWQTRFVQSLGIGQIEITNRDNASFSDLSNFKVSVWDESPADGGTKLWEKDYFSTGSLGRGETLRIDGGEVSDTSTRRLGSVHTGRVVRIELLGTNKNGNGRLALENVRVAASFDSPSLGNVAQRGIASQKNDHYGDGGGRIGAGSAIDAIDGDISTVSNFTSAKSEPGVWWQVELPQETPVEQIVLYNRTDSASRLNNFNVTVWDGDPEGGGTELWGQTYNYSSSAPVFSTGSFIGAGGALIIDGSDTDGGLRLDDVQGARYVRVQLNTANILSLAEVQVWTPVDMVDLPGPTTSANLDLGTPFSPVHNSNWQGVSPTTYGDIWWYGQPNSDYQLAAPNNNINRDFVTSTEEATLNVRVQPGVYRVTLNMGDADNDRDNMQVWAESQLISNDIDSPAGQYSYVWENGASSTPREFDVEVYDGILSLKFDDTSDVAGAAPGWVLNRMSLTRVADLPTVVNPFLSQYDYDLGTSTSPLEGGFGLIKHDTYGDISWSGTVASENRNTGSDLNRDFVYGSSAATLEHSVSDGIWDVTVNLGDEDLARDNMMVSVEGLVQLADVDTAAGEYLETTFRVIVSDGSLSLQMDDNGGVDNEWVLNRLSLSKVNDLPIAPGDFNADLKVDGEDLSQWQTQYGTQGAADANLDGQVSGLDFLTWQRNFGIGVPIVTTLVDANIGNGSFEDHTGSTGLAVNENEQQALSTGGTPATIPSWTLNASTGIGGWKASDPNVASDGTAYAVAYDSAEVLLTSSTLTSHVTAEGDEYTLEFDTGSSNGAPRVYDARLIFNGVTRSLGSVIDTNTVSGIPSEFLMTRSIQYTAVAGDVGFSPIVEIFINNQGGLSKSYLDNVVLIVSQTATGPLEQSVASSTLSITSPSSVTSTTALNESEVIPDAAVAAYYELLTQGTKELSEARSQDSTIDPQVYSHSPDSPFVLLQPLRRSQLRPEWPDERDKTDAAEAEEVVDVVFSLDEWNPTF